MENVTLSQGAKGFNTARFAMRDQFMSIGTPRVNIMKELISRNEVDTKLLMMEQELMRASVANPKAMPNLVNKYQQYVREVYGDKVADKYISQQKLQGTSSDAITAMKKDASEFFGAGGVNINTLRENPELAADTFLANDRNMVGKIFVTESGGLVHMPSANALGGLTILPDGRVTFEGKNASNVPKFYQLMENARSNGFITDMAMDKISSNMYSLADRIINDRAKIQIHSASYARNVYDRSLTQHDIMGMIDDKIGAFSSMSNEARSTIGHIASISEHDAKLLIQDEILKTIENIKQKQIGGSNAVVKSLNELRSQWIYQDHVGVINYMQKRLFDDTGKLRDLSDKYIHKISKSAANKIVGERISYTERLKSQLNTLYGMAQNKHKYTDAQFTEQINKIVSHIESKSLKMFGLRDPDIYASSESALHGFISREISWAGKEKLSKVISIAFAAARNMAGDFDGDKFKYLLLHYTDSHDAVKSSIRGIQMKSENMLKEAKKRIKILTGRPDGKKQIFNLSEEQLAKTVDQIFAQDKASMAAAFMTKAYTGSLNIGALGIKGELHKSLINKKLSTEELEDALSFVNSIPSLFTEQQAISSKQLSNYIGKSIKNSKTPIETMISSIGKLDEAQIMNIIKETGTVSPSILTHLGNVINNPGQKSAYGNAIDLANTILSYQTGYSKVTEEQLEKHKSFLQGERSEDEWRKFVSEIMESQKGKISISETDWAKKINMPSNIMEVFSKMHEAGSNNLNKIIKDLDEYITKQGDTIGEKSIGEIFSHLENIRQNSFHLAEDIYGSETSLLPKAARKLKGWDKITNKVEPIIDWFKAAPKERIGGAMALTMIGTAILNLTTGSTIDSKDDVPSMNNPGMEYSSRYYGSQGIFSGSNSHNKSFGLLTSGNLSNRQTVSYVNSATGSPGYHSVSLRNDGTNPYLDKMSYYN
jgi:polyhydroxyalkanoate synthesis regulator phasin